MHILIEEEETETIKYLLFDAEIKADPNIIDNKSKITPLVSAIQDGYLDIVKLLIEAKADANQPVEGMTPV